MVCLPQPANRRQWEGGVAFSPRKLPGRYQYAACTSAEPAPRAFAFRKANQAPTARPMPMKICRSEEHTSELQSLMRISYAVFCLKKKNTKSQSTIEREDTTRENNNEE